MGHFSKRLWNMRTKKAIFEKKPYLRYIMNSKYVKSATMTKPVVEDSLLTASWYNQSITIYTHVIHPR